MPAFRNHTGKRFGMVLILALVGFQKGSRQSIWLIKCDCGAVKKAIRMGEHVKSCGCMRPAARTVINKKCAEYGRNYEILGELRRAEIKPFLRKQYA